MAQRSFDAAFIERQIKGELHRLGRSAGRRLLEPTSTWDHRPRVDVSQPTVRGGDLVVSVKVTDDEYYWLDGGTRVRYATMSPNFVSKTTPNSFAARAGRGKVSYVDRMVPRPGITARNWTNLASGEYQALLQQVVDNVMQSISRNGLGAFTGKTNLYRP